MKDLELKKQVLIHKIEADRKAVRHDIDALKFGSTENVVYALSKGIGSIVAISNIIDKTLETDKDSAIKQILKFSSFIPLGLTIFDILLNHQQK